MWAYFDTSALVKRYVAEPGRPALMALLRRHDVVTSRLLVLEMRSALRRRAGDGSLDARRVPEILRRMTADRAFWAVMDVSNDVLDAAEALAGEHSLRALDAIHVASAQLFARRLNMPQFPFVTADARQTAAAAALGMKPVSVVS